MQYGSEENLGANDSWTLWDALTSAESTFMIMISHVDWGDGYGHD